MKIELSCKHSLEIQSFGLKGNLRGTAIWLSHRKRQVLIFFPFFIAQNLTFLIWLQCEKVFEYDIFSCFLNNRRIDFFSWHRGLNVF